MVSRVNPVILLMIHWQSCAIGHELPVVYVSGCAKSRTKARNTPAVDVSAPMSGSTSHIGVTPSSAGTSAQTSDGSTNGSINVSTVGKSAQTPGGSTNAGLALLLWKILHRHQVVIPTLVSLSLLSRIILHRN